MNSMFDTVLAPLEWVVAWLMVGFHTIFTAIGLSAEAGFTWALSIVGLVIVIRIILIPLFVKQIHASRRMQLIQPEMQKIQKKYKGKTDPESRQAMTQETMGLYKRTGTNPFSSCLPLLLQSPIFVALFRVLANMPAIAAGTEAGDRAIDQEGGRSGERVHDLRCAPVCHLPAHDHHRARGRGLSTIGHQREDRLCGDDRAHVGLTVHQHASADDEEHAGERVGQPVRQAAEAHDVSDAADVRLLGRHLRDRCPALLADHQPLDDGPAVLHHSAYAGSPLTR